jgi:hypothetical protein
MTETAPFDDGARDVVELFLTMARALEPLQGEERGRVLRALLFLYAPDVAAEGASFDAWCRRHRVSP